MTISKRLVGLLTITAGVIPTGCNVGDSPDALALDSELEFRDDGGVTGPPKGNTNFLGASDDYPLDNLPLKPGGEDDVQILEIRGNSCHTLGGPMLNGPVSTLPVSSHVNLTVSSDGVLGPITVAPVATPAVQCQLTGSDWVGTEWEIVATYSEGPSQEVVETDLRLVDVAIDSLGSTAYEFHVNEDRVLDQLPMSTYVPTCDEDPDPTDPGLEYHAYLIPNLHVAEDTGNFSYVAHGNTMFLACLSGAVGKTPSWGYAPWDHDAETHELATRMARADYYGNGVSYTTAGTKIWLQDDLNPAWQYPAPAPTVIEAGWSVAEGKAICVSQPRKPDLVPGGLLLPQCTQQLLGDANIITSVMMP